MAVLLVRRASNGRARAHAHIDRVARGDELPHPVAGARTDGTHRTGTAVERLLLELRHHRKDDAMNATELLKKQHREVEDLFEKFTHAKSHAQRRELFEKLAASLAAHDVIERDIFYPACKRVMGMPDDLHEAIVEHGVVEFCLFNADQAQDDDDFQTKVDVLKEIVEHHVGEEEDDLFPQVEDAIDDVELDELGAQMKERFDQLQDQDFRGPLRATLKQVLAGATETEPADSRKPAPKKNGRRAKAKRAAQRAASSG
jgi:hemerythrin superfamily protein